MRDASQAQHDSYSSATQSSWRHFQSRPAAGPVAAWTYAAGRGPAATSFFLAESTMRLKPSKVRAPRRVRSPGSAKTTSSRRGICFLFVVEHSENLPGGAGQFLVGRRVVVKVCGAMENNVAELSLCVDGMPLELLKKLGCNSAHIKTMTENLDLLECAKVVFQETKSATGGARRGRCRWSASSRRDAQSLLAASHG